jgi:hypothetical protein
MYKYAPALEAAASTVFMVATGLFAPCIVYISEESAVDIFRVTEFVSCGC